MTSSFNEHDCLPFLRQAWRSKGAVGALLPSSRRLAEVVVRQSAVSEADRIIELGPGPGAITGEIMRRKKPSARILAIERDRGFARDLSSRFPGVQVVNGCASTVEEVARSERFGMADCIVSTVPWSLMEAHVKSTTLYAARRCLRYDGVFVTAVCYGLHWLPSGRWLDRMLRAVFASVTRSPVISGSFPPMAVYRCSGDRRSTRKPRINHAVCAGLASSPAYRRIAFQRAVI